MAVSLVILWRIRQRGPRNIRYFACCHKSTVFARGHRLNVLPCHLVNILARGHQRNIHKWYLIERVCSRWFWAVMSRDCCKTAQSLWRFSAQMPDIKLSLCELHCRDIAVSLLEFCSIPPAGYHFSSKIFKYVCNDQLYCLNI